MRRIFPLALAAMLGASMVGVGAALPPGGVVIDELASMERRERRAATPRYSRYRFRSKGPQAHRARRANRLHVSRRMRRKHRRAGK